MTRPRSRTEAVTQVLAERGRREKLPALHREWPQYCGRYQLPVPSTLAASLQCHRCNRSTVTTM